MKTWAEFKKEWVAALRSGEYQQARGRLRSHHVPNGFCCLGVAADLICKADPEHFQWATTTFVCKGRLGSSSLNLSHPLMYSEYEEISQQLLSHDGELTLEARLVRMNDKDNADFSKIANYIEGLK